MAKLTTNHCLYWFGTAASIPSGFSRYSPTPALDVARFLSGAPLSSDPGSTGGSLTHTHTVVDHDHVVDFHSHTFTGSSVTHATTGSDPGTGGGAQTLANATHAHASANTQNAAQHYTDVATGLVTDACASGARTPPFVEALLIRPDADGAEVPTSATVLFQSATPPSGFVAQDGTGDGTPDLTDQYIRIAANATTGGGATGGTIADHTHPLAAHSHAVSATHSHGSAQGGSSAPDVTVTQVGVAQPLRGSVSLHHPAVNAYAASAGSTSPTGPITSSAFGSTLSPKHLRLAPMKNTGGASLPEGVVVPYIGTLATLATLADWKLCDGSGGTPTLYSIAPEGRIVKCAFTSLGTGAGFDDHHHNNWTGHAHAMAGSHTHVAAGDDAEQTKRTSTIAGVLMRTPVGDSHIGEHTWTFNATVPPDTIGTAIDDTGFTYARDPWLEVLFVKYVPPKGRSYGYIIG